MFVLCKEVARILGVTSARFAPTRHDSRPGPPQVVKFPGNVRIRSGTWAGEMALAELPNLHPPVQILAAPTRFLAKPPIVHASSLPGRSALTISLT
jgi:hypothetical protein